MSTKVIKEGNVTTTIMDMTNGVGGKSAEVSSQNKQQLYKCDVTKICFISWWPRIDSHIEVHDWSQWFNSYTFETD